MTSATLLQIFLLANIFVMGVLTAIAVRQAHAHFKPHPIETEKPPHRHAPHIQLPPAVRERLLQSSQVNFEAVLNHSSAQLHRSLAHTTVQLTKRLEKLGNQIVSDEMTRYRTTLDQLRKQAETAITQAQAEIGQHQTELKAKLNEQQIKLEAKMKEDMATEKEHLLLQMDTKLADAVASFLTETLQHNVDLGAQSTYLTTMLDEHKAELAKGISDES